MTTVEASNSTRTARLNRTPQPGDLVRRHELHVHWPILSRGSWGKMIDDGRLPKHEIPGVRGCFVAVDDVLVILSGKLPVGASVTA